MNSNLLIKKYSSENLIPILKSYKFPTDIIDIAVEDIENRLSSIISRWNNEAFRKTILVVGYEEASYYEPPVNLDIRSLVVLTVRNSIIENLSSTKEAAKKHGFRRPPIPSDDIPIFTKDAINFFSKINMSEVSYNIVSNENDPFAKLPELYPVAWEALKYLSDWSNQYHTYTPLIKQPLDLDYLYVYNNEKQERSNNDVLSGMDSSINVQLLKQLQLVKCGNSFFLSDSFKSVTRNLDKLFKILEFVLRSKSLFISSNYHIANGYVARRDKLLKPGHTTKEMVMNFNNFSGLRKSHREAMQTALKLAEQV